MRIDSHQHFWKYSSAEYGWIDESMKVIRRNFLPADLKKELNDNHFEGCVAVQARQTLEETEWLLTLAEENNFIKGVVGWVDLCSADGERQLAKFSQHKKLVGVRHVVQGEADDRFMLREDFMRGVGLLKNYNLTYDILIYPKHLPVAVEFASRFPDQPFVLDHLAKPFIKDQKKQPWKSDMERLAELPNVCCKVSGMVTEANWQEWKESDFHFYMDVIYHTFGEDRVMFGSDWPVCRVAASYQQVAQIVEKYFGKALSPEGMGKLMGGNCAEFYNLR